MNPIQMREATLDDVPVLLEMMEAFNAFERIPWTRATGESPLRTLLSGPALGIVGIVEEAATPFGYFVLAWSYDLEWNGRDAFLTELFVVPEVRGRGVGRTALEHAEALAMKHGANALHLMVRPENERAYDLYLRSGYVSPPRIFLTKVFGSK